MYDKDLLLYSLLQAVMESTVSPGLSDEGLETIKEETAAGDNRDVLHSPTPPSEAGGSSFSDEIANAFKRRKEGQQQDTVQPKATTSPPPPPSTGGEGSLGDEIANAFKRREERKASPENKEPAPTPAASGRGGSLEDQLAAAIKKRSTSPPAKQEEGKVIDEETRELSGSLGNLQTDILSMLTSFGNSEGDKNEGTDKEKLIKKTEPEAKESPATGQ